MIRDLYPGEHYKIEHVRLEIVSFRDDRLMALVALRKLLNESPEETRAILDSLPYEIYDGPVENGEWLSLLRAARSAGFGVRELRYLKDMVA